MLTFNELSHAGKEWIHFFDQWGHGVKIEVGYSKSRETVTVYDRPMITSLYPVAYGREVNQWCATCFDGFEGVKVTLTTLLLLDIARLLQPHKGVTVGIVCDNAINTFSCQGVESETTMMLEAYSVGKGDTQRVEVSCCLYNGSISDILDSPNNFVHKVTFFDIHHLVDYLKEQTTSQCYTQVYRMVR